MVLFMESAEKVPDRIQYSIYGHSGTSSRHILADDSSKLTNVTERWDLLQRMRTIAQSSATGDNTLRAIRDSIEELRLLENVDDRILIAFSDANMGPYDVSSEALKEVLQFGSSGGNNRIPVQVFLVFIAEEHAAKWLKKCLPPQNAFFLQ